LLGTAVFLMVSVLAGPILSVAMLLLVGASVGLVMASVWPISQTLAGPQVSGQWTGLQCAFGNSSGAIVSLVTGFLLDRTGDFFWAFVVTAVVSVLGVLFWNFMARPIEPVPWTRRTSVDLGEAGVETV
jgi:MFS family permease